MPTPTCGGHSTKANTAYKYNWNSLHGCWAHLSPRVRMGLTSSPTIGGGTKTKMGRRVVLISDILKVSERSCGFKLGKGAGYWDIESSTPFISATGSVRVRVADYLVALESGILLASMLYHVQGARFTVSEDMNPGQTTKKVNKQVSSQSFDVSAAH